MGRLGIIKLSQCYSIILHCEGNHAMIVRLKPATLEMSIQFRNVTMDKDGLLIEIRRPLYVT